MRILLLVILAVIIALPSCGLFRKKPKMVVLDRPVRLVGRVERVEESARYVLIRRYGPWRFDEETEVAESRGAAGRTASLMPTGEKLGEHIAADIRSGQVELGDAVYIRRLKVAGNVKPSEKPENTAQPESQRSSAENP